jgi:LysM repeat protein
MATTNALETPAEAVTAPTAVGCPYLLSADGAWRASTPARDHRCTAVVPAAVLAADKQRRLCLTTEHRSCATYLAATGATAVGDLPLTGRYGRREGSRPMARTTPVVLDHGRVSLVLPGLAGERPIGQVLLIGLMGLAFAAILVARLATGGGAETPTGSGGLAGAAGGGASPAASATESPSSSAPSGDDDAEPTASPNRTLVPTEGEPTGPPEEAGGSTTDPTDADDATYTVRRGDTLSGIAARYGTTWKVIAELNEIKDPSRLKVGVVLQLP